MKNVLKAEKIETKPKRTCQVEWKSINTIKINIDKSIPFKYKKLKLVGILISDKKIIIVKKKYGIIEGSGLIIFT